MKNFPFIFNKNVLKHIFILLIAQFGFSQSIGAPTYTFGFICATPTTNYFDCSFTFTPASFSAGNKFRLELSDKDGFFPASNPTILAEITATVSPATFSNFAIPANTDGIGYRLRVTSTSPVAASPSSTPFEAHYMPFDTNFFINGKAETISICGSNGSVKLEIDPDTPTIRSPRFYPNLKYKWFKDGEIISNESTYFINVTTSGVYRVFIDYGSCSTYDDGQSSKSQPVTVSIATTSTSVAITSSKGTNICPSDPTTLSATPGYAYQWYKDNAKITGATSSTYQTGVAGTYKAVANPGTACESTSNSITLTAEVFNLDIDAKVSPSINYIDAGQSLTITATTDAVSPTYTWLEPGNTTPVSTTDNYTVVTPIDGDYKLKVRQNSGCVFEKEIIFRVKIGIESTKLPNLISPNNKDGANDTWIIPDQYKSTDIEILILDSFGKEVFRKKNYDDSWPSGPIEFKSVNPIFYYVISKGGTALKKGSITVIK
ncbi:gliding motility-associated C-terminal domain-containing protein [Flavobacterium sp. H122]|uniref:T9SS type B sorting domain-containing protein n=1 Tax=Flavobacterium sp. H122 TaxID=2529860 RepID=UPI0010A9BFD3|nr:gliding motility-associated C-terminal domain-containing protein [Flavobacterium sp. H122]